MVQNVILCESFLMKVRTETTFLLFEFNYRWAAIMLKDWRIFPSTSFPIVLHVKSLLSDNWTQLREKLSEFLFSSKKTHIILHFGATLLFRVSNKIKLYIFSRSRSTVGKCSQRLANKTIGNYFSRSCYCNSTLILTNASVLNTIIFYIQIIIFKFQNYYFPY